MNTTLNRDSNEHVSPQNRFPQTHWTALGRAGNPDSPDHLDEFGAFYRAYVPPLQAWLLSHGFKEDDAEDLMQELFQSLLIKNSLASVTRKGKFRTWLLTCLKNLAHDRRSKLNTQKRGGNQEHLGVGGDIDCSEVDPVASGRHPDEEYNFQFARKVMQDVIQGLEMEYRDPGRAELFERLRLFLSDKKPGRSQASCAAEVGMTEAAFTQAVRRIRDRFRLLLRQEVAKLVSKPDDHEEIEDELRFLRQCLTSKTS